MILEQVDVAVGQFLAKHVFDTIAEQAAVYADKALLGEFADEGSNVLVLYIGIGIVFRTCCRVGRVAVVD